MVRTTRSSFARSRAAAWAGLGASLLAGTLMLAGGSAAGAATPSRPDAATTTTTTPTPGTTTAPGSINACKLVSTSQLQSILGGSIAKTTKLISGPQQGICQLFVAKKKGVPQNFAFISVARPAPPLAQFQQGQLSGQAVSGVGDAAYVVAHTSALRPAEIDFVKSGTEVSIRVYKFNKNALVPISTSTLTKLAKSVANKL